jgi:hypothetical protein
MARVVVNRSFAKDMGRPENSRAWQREAGRRGKAAISAAAPVRFGTLAGTIFVRFVYSGGTTRIIYGSTRPYAAFQEHGTGIYGPLKRYITPKRALYLRWTDSTAGLAGGPDGGAVHYAKRVRGSKPTKFMYRGLSETFGPGQTRSFAATGGKPGT